MIAVADAGPLIHLSAVGLLDLLRELYGRVVVPRRVFDEVVVDGQGRPVSAEVAGASWLEVPESDPDNVLRRALNEELDAGESAALALAVDLQAELVLIDERKGRLAAARMGLVTRGTIGILVEAKRKGRIDRIGPVLDALSKSGVWLSSSVIEMALRSAGE